MNKTCIQNILSVLGKKSAFVPKDTIQIAVCNVSNIASDTVSRTLRMWSRDNKKMDSLIEKTKIQGKNGRYYTHYRLRKTL
jgi:hypothetical protein